MARQSPSGIGVWFKEEIENTLQAIDTANLDIAQHIDTPEMEMYRRGYEAAMEAVSRAFGIQYSRTRTPLQRRQLPNGPRRYSCDP